MSIIKNEPVYPFKDGDYCKPRHIVVKGGFEEIGYDLGTLAKNEYGCKLGVYEHPVYAAARREYLARNWSPMLQRQNGVFRAFGLPEDDEIFDGTFLPFDWYDTKKSSGNLGMPTCSGLVLPCEKTDTGATYVARNFDMPAAILWSEAFGKQPPQGAHHFNERAIVLETHPDDGFKSIIIGGNELLCPWVDGINEKGLFVTDFHDPAGVGSEGTSPSGLDISGISTMHLFLLLLESCTTVEEAKVLMLTHRIMQTQMCSHFLIADASGNATVFEIDKVSQSYVFTDRAANEPLFVTNHPVHTYPTPDTYPDIDMGKEHNTFTRQVMLREKYAELSPPFTREDATALSDAVRCSFVDDKRAEAAFKERTLSNVIADLSKPEIAVRWYLGDDGPIAGTNHMRDRMSGFYTFGF